MKKTTTKAPPKLVMLRMPPDEHYRLRMAAAAADMPMATFAREAIRQLVEKTESIVRKKF